MYLSQARASLPSLVDMISMSPCMKAGMPASFSLSRTALQLFVLRHRTAMSPYPMGLAESPEWTVYLPEST